MERAASSRYLCKSCSRALRNASPRSSFATNVAASQRRSLVTAPLATHAWPASHGARPHQPLPFQRPSSARRPLSSAPRRAVQAVLNPRHDDDGNEMAIEITPRAANRLAQIAAKEDSPDVALRVTVESGGCHGFQYLMSLIKMADVDQAEDTVFEGDKGARVVMDEPSLDLLKGSKVDYTMELIGSQFKITDNPLATSSCGCGTSFDIKAA